MSKKKAQMPIPVTDDVLQARVMFQEWDRSALAAMDQIDAHNLLRTIAAAIAWGREQGRKDRAGPADMHRDARTAQC